MVRGWTLWDPVTWDAGFGRHLTRAVGVARARSCLQRVERSAVGYAQWTCDYTRSVPKVLTLCVGLAGGTG